MTNQVCFPQTLGHNPAKLGLKSGLHANGISLCKLHLLIQVLVQAKSDGVRLNE